MSVSLSFFRSGVERAHVCVHGDDGDGGGGGGGPSVVRSSRLSSGRPAVRPSVLLPVAWQLGMHTYLLPLWQRSPLRCSVGRTDIAREARERVPVTPTCNIHFARRSPVGRSVGLNPADRAQERTAILNSSPRSFSVRPSVAAAIRAWLLLAAAVRRYRHTYE